MTAVKLDHMRSARARASMKSPYLAHALFACRLIESEKVPTCTIDKVGRIYYNREFCEKLSVDELSAVLQHEVWHLLRDHSHRAGQISGVVPTIWNIAGDCEINDDLKDAGLVLPACAVFPKMFELADGDLAENYYATLLSKASKAIQKLIDSGKVTVLAGACGSGAGGEKQPGEQDGNGEGPGEEPLTDAEMTLLRRHTAREINDRKGKGIGNLPAGMTRWAESILEPPRVDWRRELSAAIRLCLAHKRGMVDFSYSRPARRQAGDIIWPAMTRPHPRLAVVIDTSGSMGDEDLAHAVTEAMGVVKACGEPVRVLSCDMNIHGDAMAVTAGQMVECLAGGGGTDMGNALGHLAKGRRPDIAIVITDGETPWPVDAPPFKVIVCLVRGNADCPHWARVVRVEQ